MIYLVTGWPGTGKSTVAVMHAIERYAREGRRVAANFPIDFAPVCARRGSVLSSASCWVLPDRPSRADLDFIGDGGESEERAGLLIIDEAGGWLNSRNWQGMERERLIDWLTQSRKRFWDIIMVAQSPGMLDKQVREAVCECVARIRRLDRVRVLGVRLPRVHFAIVRYGLDQNAPLTERWIYRGADAHLCFGSYRKFGFESAHYSVLPAKVTRWPFESRFDEWASVLRGMGPLPGLVRRVGLYWGQKHIKRPSRARRSGAGKHQLVRLLMRLPPDQRVKHFRRLEALGAFGRS